MAGNQQIVSVSEDSERAIITYATRACELLLNQFSMRTNLETIDRYYQRETDWTPENLRAKYANKFGDKRHIQNPQIPVIMPQVRAALAYFVNTFLTGYPIFDVTSDPANEDAAMQLATIIAENSIHTGWERELVMFFNDGLKYNLQALELEWKQETVAAIETDVSFPNSAKPVNKLWSGNSLKRLDLYNTFFDPRVSPSQVCKRGEYAGYIELYSRIQLKQLCNDLFGDVQKDTIDRAFASGPAPGGLTSSGSPFAYYIPLVNPFPVMQRQNLQTFDWMAWAEGMLPAGGKPAIHYGNVYEVATVYGRILPRDFGFNKVPQPGTPQIWKFKIVNRQVVLYAERQTNAHGYIPIFLGQPLEDGLDFQTKSFAANVMDMQDIATSLWASRIASKRRLIGDRVLYDPSRIRKEDINTINPEAKIPVRPSAYGKTIAEAVYQFPFHDEQTDSLVNDANMVNAMADKINQQNPAQQGQFVKGNKTKTEYEDVQGHGNGNNQTMAIMIEAQVFTPMKEAIKLNILQYQNDTTLFNRDAGQQVKINVTDLRKSSVQFKVSDGLIPVEKQMSTDEFQTALQVLGSSPALAAGYQMAPMFSYIMKLRGADLTTFEIPQDIQQFQQQMQTWTGIVQEAVKVMGKNVDPSQLDALTQALGKLLQTMPKPPQSAQQQQAGQAGGTQNPQQSQTPPSPTTPALQSTQG